MKKWTAPVFLAVCLLAGCAAENEGTQVQVQNEGDSSDYTLETVLRRDVELHTSIYATYTYVGGQDYTLGKSGRITSVYVSEGDTVSIGDLLASCTGYDTYKQEVTDYTDQIESDQEDLNSLTEERDEKVEELDIRLKYGNITQSEYDAQMREIADDYDDRIAELTDAITIEELRLQEADNNLYASAIYSETSGVVSYALPVSESRDWWNQSSGRRVDADTVIVSVGSADSRGFESYETDYADHYSVGDEAVLSTSSGQEYITEVSKIIDNVVCFTLKDSDITLESGTMVSTNLSLGESDGALSISKNALHTAGEKYYVYVLDDAGLKQMRYVTVGLIGNNYVEITEGLAEGEQVVK